MRTEVRKRFALKIGFEAGVALWSANGGNQLGEWPGSAFLERGGTASPLKESIDKFAQLGPVFHLPGNGPLFDFRGHPGVEDKGIGKLYRKWHKERVAYCYLRFNLQSN